MTPAARALAERNGRAVDHEHLSSLRRVGLVRGDLPIDEAPEHVLIARRATSFVGQEFAITRELRRRFLRMVDGT